MDKYPERAPESVFVDGKHSKGRIYGGLQKAQPHYSPKLGTAAHQFQCVALHTGMCIHVTDVEPAAMHDITMYEKIDHYYLRVSEQGELETR